MREGVRFNRFHTGLAAVAALFVFGTEPASAQEAPPYIAELGFREYQFNDQAPTELQIPYNNSFTVQNADAPRLDLGETHRTRDESEEPREDEIVVTAERDENFAPTDEFDGNIFDRMGVEPSLNPNLEGLAFLTPEEMRDNGWALTVPVLGSRRGETGPFLSLGAGRPERIITGGVRF